MTTPRKFRVWDPESEEMHEPPHNFVLNSEGVVGRLTTDWGGTIEGLPDHECLFYTGLTDAEGTEVYCGDVLAGKVPAVVRVYWSKSDHRWACKNITTQLEGTFSEDLISKYNLVVESNIYLG